jgi:hypothetical protein
MSGVDVGSIAGINEPLDAKGGKVGNKFDKD